MNSRILIVDDDRDLSAMLKGELGTRSFSPVIVGSAEDAETVMRDEEFDVVVTDLRMCGAGGLALCAHVAENRPDIPVIVMTGFGSLDSAVATIRAGAFDLVIKPFRINELVVAIERAMKHRISQDEVRRLKLGAVQPDAADTVAILGSSAAISRLYDLVDRVASSEASVLITGESGTGKELVARSLHQRGPRARGPFVAINCAAMPETLLESELFGHVRGAFTDAKGATRGLFVEASGGTLFLDEIGDLPLAMQPKLLRALDTRRVRPVGGTTEVPFDAHLIAASNRDLELAVAEKHFRDDLYYRINVVQIDVPPLRARGADVLSLAQYFLERVANRCAKSITSLSSGVAEKLLAYPWPGNVRELQNCIERAVAFARYEELVVDDLPASIREYRPAYYAAVTEDTSALEPMNIVERRYILRVLDAAAGNRSIAARILGYDRKTLYRRLDSYHLPR